MTFFGIKFANNISSGAAGWEIASIFNDPENELAWNKYLFLTKDFSGDSNQLTTFDRTELDSLQLPQDWTASAAASQYRSDIVASAISDGSPFDSPEPEIEFRGRSFMFTGKFTFGDRSACQGAVESRGGSAPDTKTVVPEIDYLVIGTDGSKAWKMGAYGNKIEKAILLRRVRGTPAIVSEDHWVHALGIG